jgi:hypothetical protein
MKSRKPPYLATWLIEHAIPGKRNEALAGDLFEQFSQGRSPLWYWRQALGTVLHGYAREWRVFAWAGAITLAWAFLVNYSQYWNRPGAREFFGFGTTEHRLLSFFSAVASILFRALFLMFPASRTFSGLGSPTQLMGNSREQGLWPRSLRCTWKPLAIGYAVAAISAAVPLAILPARQHPILVANIAALVPVFLAVLVMTFIAPPESMRTGIFTLFRIDPPGDS